MPASRPRASTSTSPIARIDTGVGKFGLTWNNTFLLNYDVIVPITGGTQTISREGTEQGSPSQAFPKWKSIGVLDWDGTSFGASLTGRYISKLKETGQPATR